MAIQPEQKGVTYITQFSDPFQLGGHGIEDITVYYKIFFVAGMMNVLAHNGKIAELKGKYFVQEVVMIPAQVDHFCLTCCQPLHDQLEKGGVFFLPFAGLAELPSVYDIAIQDERVTGVVAEKVDGFFNPGVLYAQVNIRQYNGTIVRLQWFGVSQN